MCGICGVIDWSDSPDAAALVRRMTPTMSHRGPDDEGYLMGERLGIGMRRLSIIDLEGGHQPIFNEDGTVGVVLNGEIYNFRELRKQLEDRGHAFRTRSDSEVVAHAYEEWGADCVERLQGMFALAVYDRRRNAGSFEFRVSSSESGARGAGGTLFLARDRLGIKPLYYYIGSSEFRVSGFELEAEPDAHHRDAVSSSEFRVSGSEFEAEPDVHHRDAGASSEFGIAGSEFEAEPDVHHRDTENTEEAQRRSGEHSPKLETRNSKPETRFLFASEVRTLLASGIVARKLSRAALESYLLFGSVSEPMTLVEGILSLPPGHRMTIDLSASAGSVKLERYWNIAARNDVAMGTSEEAGIGSHGEAGTGRQATNLRRNGHNSNQNASDSAQRVRELLEQSVRSHLIADVPVGVFLSGGIDSTSLAALASREVSGVHTFNVAFPEKEFSEAGIARRTAEKFGTTHQEMMLSGDEMLARMGDAVSALDQPTMDGINTYFVSWAARQAGLKVALSGLGGDELFGGYSTFRRTSQYQHLAAAGIRLPGGLRSVMASAMTDVGGHFMPGDAARKIAALWNGSDALPDPFYFGRTLFTPVQVTELMNGAMVGSVADEPPLWRKWLSESAAQARKLDPFAAVSCMEAQSYMVSTLLRDTDSMSMAHSLEVRVPFLDHLLVEFITRLPQQVKLKKGTPKALLVAALDDVLPSEVVQQAKRGFTFPWAAWLRGPLKEKVEKGLSDLSPALQEVLNSENARGIWQSYLEGKTSWSRAWSLYVLNEWTKKHLD